MFENKTLCLPAPHPHCLLVTEGAAFFLLRAARGVGDVLTGGRQLLGPPRLLLVLVSGRSGGLCYEGNTEPGGWKFDRLESKRGQFYFRTPELGHFSS